MSTNFEDAKKKILNSKFYQENTINEGLVESLTEILVFFDNLLFLDDEDDQKIIKHILSIYFF